jgi:hypothetical protein
MTPCDLYSQLKGRTLWIIGDSMSKDLIKARGGRADCYWGRGLD